MVQNKDKLVDKEMNKEDFKAEISAKEKAEK